MSQLVPLLRLGWHGSRGRRAGRWARHGVAGLVAVAILVLFGTRPAAAWHGRKGDLKHQVESLEEKWRTAQLAGDVSTMDHMLSDDYVGITMSGQVVTKPQQLERIRTHAQVLTRLDLEDMRVKLVGHIAVVTVLARVEGVTNGHPLNGEFRYTRVYQQQPAGSWQITNFEATHVPARHDGTPASPGGAS